MRVEDLNGIEMMEFTARIMTDTSRLNRPIRQRYLLDCRRHKTRRAILAAFTALIFNHSSPLEARIVAFKNFRGAHLPKRWNLSIY